MSDTPEKETVEQEETVEEETVDAPPQQSDQETETTTPSGQQGPPEGYVEKERFSGAIKKIQTLTTELETKGDTISQLNSKIEQLSGEVAAAKAEKQTIVGQRDETIEQHITTNKELEQELKQLRTFKRKVEKAKEMGRPELIKVLDIIPDMEDEEALETAMQDVLSFRDEGAQARESELKSGIMPSSSSIENVPDKPTTEEGWERYVQKFDEGTQEHQQAMDEWGDWLFNQS